MHSDDEVRGRKRERERERRADDDGEEEEKDGRRGGIIQGWYHHNVGTSMESSYLPTYLGRYLLAGWIDIYLASTRCLEGVLLRKLVHLGVCLPTYLLTFQAVLDFTDGCRQRLFLFGLSIRRYTPS